MKKNSYLGIIIGFILAAIIVGFVYYKGRQRKPLVYPVIPTSTVDWTKLLQNFNSLSISIVEKGPFNWDNKDDIGQEAGSEWQMVDTDPYFIVYYKNDAMHLNVQNARRVLQIAHEAIPEIQSLMGSYHFPEDCNGRKLAIYAASSVADYQATIDRLFGEKVNSSSSVGMFICHIGPLGCLADGIVLHPMCFDYESAHDNWAETVLRHEMNHYAYFSSIDFSKEIDHPLWISEGLAEYASIPGGQISDRDSIDYIAANCHVTGDFPVETLSQYWAGRSFYKFIEDTQGIFGVRSFIQNLYENDLLTVLGLSFPDVSGIDSLWVQDMLERKAIADSLRNAIPSV